MCEDRRLQGLWLECHLLKGHALLASDRYVDAKEMFAYDLAPVPTAMFEEDL